MRDFYIYILYSMNFPIDPLNLFCHFCSSTPLTKFVFIFTFMFIFRFRMLSIIENKYMGLLDLFDSLEQLTLTSNQYVHRSSLFGKFAIYVTISC